MVRFFIKLFFVATLIVASLCLAYGFFIEPKRIILREHDVAIKSHATDALRIGVISDIHIAGFHMPPKRVAQITEQINALDLDLILIAGDFINGHKARAKTSKAFDQAIEDGIIALGGLQAAHGVYAVIGNHDVWYDARYVETALEGAGITVLTNEAVNLAMGVCLVGFADNTTQDEDPNSVAACEKKHDIIGLMHSPDSFKYLRSDVKLAAAGHTHGGQINIPFLGWLTTITDIGGAYKQGLKSYHGKPVYISAGLGTSALPARFRAQPEITVLTLRRSLP